MHKRGVRLKNVADRNKRLKGGILEKVVVMRLRDSRVDEICNHFFMVASES